MNFIERKQGAARSGSPIVFQGRKTEPGRDMIMKRIGIDIGTTTISAVVLEDESRRVLESRTVPGGTFLISQEAALCKAKDSSRMCEVCPAETGIRVQYEDLGQTGHIWERIQDAEFMVGKAKAVLDELLDNHPDAVSIGLTGQMHGILYLDEQGRAVSPLYTWQDQRGNLEESDGRSLVDLIHDICPEPVAAGYGLVTHAYLCRKGQVPAGAVSLCTIPDYFGMVLTGRKTPLLHISMAASLGLFDRKKFRFRTEVLEKLGADPLVLPEVTDEFTILGSYRGCSVTAALGDNQASFLGAVGLAPDAALLNVGTGGQISVLSEQFFETEGIEARPLTKNRFLLVGSSLCGGRAYAILERFFRNYMAAAGAGDQEQYEVMARLAQEAYMRKKSGAEEERETYAEKRVIKKDERETEEQQVFREKSDFASKKRDANFMHVETTFHGTRTDPDKRGSITNLSEDNFTPQNLVLGVLNGIARELYDLYVLIHEGTGITARRLVGSGNGVRRNPVLRQIFEEMFQARLELSAYEEEAACGAAAGSAGLPEFSMDFTKMR